MMLTSPRPYSRIHLISGTKGMAAKWPGPQRISFGEGWIKDAEFKELEEKYTLPIVKHIGALAKNIGGHGGMDFIMDWRLIDNLRNGLPPGPGCVRCCIVERHCPDEWKNR